jgi:hypothetical protein
MSITETIPDTTAANVVTNGIDTVEFNGGQFTVYTQDLNGQVSLGTYATPGEALAALDATDPS